MIPGLLRSTNCMDVLQPPLILFHGREAALECAERRPSYAHSLCGFDERV